MKTRLLIILIIGIISTSLFIGAWIAQNEKNLQDQKAKEEWQKIRESTLDSISKNQVDKNLDTDWISDEDYCGDWCDQRELYRLGCDKSILSHLIKYSNLLSEEFDGIYNIDAIGLPEGVSEEKFEECVDIIFEKRIFSSDFLRYGELHIEKVVETFKEQYSDYEITELTNSKGNVWKYQTETNSADVELILGDYRVILRSYGVPDGNMICMVVNPFPQDVLVWCPPKW